MLLNMHVRRGDARMLPIGVRSRERRLACEESDGNCLIIRAASPAAMPVLPAADPSLLHGRLGRVRIEEELLMTAM